MHIRELADAGAVIEEPSTEDMETFAISLTYEIVQHSNSPLIMEIINASNPVDSADLALLPTEKVVDFAGGYKFVNLLDMIKAALMTDNEEVLQRFFYNAGRLHQFVNLALEVNSERLLNVLRETISQFDEAHEGDIASFQETDALTKGRLLLLLLSESRIPDDNEFIQLFLNSSALREEMKSRYLLLMQGFQTALN